MVMPAFEPGIAGLFALFHPPKEMLVSIVQIPEGGLQGRGIHFIEPQGFFLLFQGCHILGAGVVVQRFARLLVGSFPKGKIVVEHKSAAPESTQY